MAAKEILDKLKNGFWEKDEEGITYKVLFSNEVYELLNCITNLQEQLKREISVRDELYDNYHNKINNLQTSLEESQEVIADYKKENEHLKFHLNDIVFNDYNVDVELGARLLRKLGYCDFDEERNVYINKHNNQPFMQEDTKEKAFYIKDDELNDYTKQLEYKIEKARECIKDIFKDKNWYENYEYNDLECKLKEVNKILQGSDKNEKI